MSRLILIGATAVLPDRVLEDATLVAEDGVIVSVEERRVAEGTDLHGALLLPGLVDSHSDGLERDLHPRPGATMDPRFALVSYEGRARGAGVTTVFHGLAFADDGLKERSIDQARTLQGVIAERADSGAGLIDHRLLLRLDARAPEAFGALKAAVDAAVAAGGVPPLVSFEDHTPGQGQYAKIEAFRTALGGAKTEAETDEYITTLMERRAGLEWHREVAIGWLSEQALAGRIRLLSHDVASAPEVVARREQGSAVAEFPTTLEAAEAAREQGMVIVAGAPNVLRGGSHSGNVSATELIEAGLVDALSSDYMPSTLLAAAFLLAQRSILPLPRAVGLTTHGGALVGGLDDRGRLEAGARADLVVATLDGPWPTVRSVLFADDQRAGRPAGRADLAAAL